MSKFTSKSLVAIAAAVMFMISAVGVAQTQCANLAFNVDKTTVARGETITGTAMLTNCSRTTQQLTVKYVLNTPNGPASMGSVKVSLRANETRVNSLSYTVPAWAQPGQYTITATAYAGSRPLSTVSVSVTVQ